MTLLTFSATKPSFKKKPITKKKKRACRIIIQNIDHYCRDSSLHGFKYLSVKGSDHALQRIFWIIKIIAALTLSFYMSNIFYSQSGETHTITKVNSNTYPVSEILYPCVTICNVNKVSKIRFQNINNILLSNGILEDEIKDFASSLHSLVSFSSYNYADKNIKNHTKIFDILKTYNYTIDKLMAEIQSQCEDILHLCTFKSRPMNCLEIMTMIKTFEGYCCSFNYFGPGSKWNTSIFKPNRARGSGNLGGLTLVLNVNSHAYLSPSRPQIGLIVMISHPLDFPEVSTRSITVEKNYATEVRVKPLKIISLPAVESIPLKYSLCKFSNDVTSKISSQYSFQTCMVECKMDLIFQMCKCIPYFYPNPKNLPLCYLTDLQCLVKNKGLFNSLLYMDINFPNATICNCMPECSDTSYSMTMVNENINKSSSVGISRELSYANKSIVSVIYPKNICTLYEKDIFLYWNDAFATYGGIFSLCIGGSILSILEIVFKIFLSHLTREKTAKKPQKFYPYIN